MPSDTLTSFLGALQASLAVLLTISYGVVASRLNLLKASSARDISKICVRLFLPALLITNVGSELHLDTGIRYVPVLSKDARTCCTVLSLINIVWALIYTLSSMALGWLLHRAFKFPAWTVPAICFNNTTALPLLLIQSLSTAGILDDLLMSEDDDTSNALKRAKSYFLVSAIVGNSLTFAIGPRLLDDEETPDEHHAKSQKDDTDTSSSRTQNDEERAGVSESESEHENPTNSDGRTSEQQEEYETETTTLLPQNLARRKSAIDAELCEEGGKYWSKVPKPLQTILHFIGPLFNAPLVGALIGGVLGLIPPLHKVFFAAPSKGGIFKAWLTESVSNIGELFATLQLVVVGAKLSSSLMKMKKGEKSGAVPLIPMFTIFFIRFVLWPA